MIINTRRLNRLNDLIRNEATGRPKLLARLLRVSESTVYRDLNFMKLKGAPIQYNYGKRTYFYEYSGNLQFVFVTQSSEHYSISF